MIADKKKIGNNTNVKRKNISNFENVNTLIPPQNNKSIELDLDENAEFYPDEHTTSLPVTKTVMFQFNKPVRLKA